jgi:hypothetical protein
VPGSCYKAGGGGGRRGGASGWWVGSDYRRRGLRLTPITEHSVTAVSQDLTGIGYGRRSWLRLPAWNGENAAAAPRLVGEYILRRKERLKNGFVSWAAGHGNLVWRGRQELQSKP